MMALCLSFNLILAQKVSPENPTYFTSDHRRIHELIKWDADPYRDIAFCRDSTLRNIGFYPQIKKKAFPHLSNPQFKPFVLDTNKFNESGYYYFYPNANWFSHLSRIDVTNKTGLVTFGQLIYPLKLNKTNVKELFKLLIQFGVVRTYIHLNAEIIITKEKEDDNSIEIYYHCLYHFCTTVCVHPEYNFKLLMVKSTGELKAEHG